MLSAEGFAGPGALPGSAATAVPVRLGRARYGTRLLARQLFSSGPCGAECEEKEGLGRFLARAAHLRLCLEGLGLHMCG